LVKFSSKLRELVFVENCHTTRIQEGFHKYAHVWYKDLDLGDEFRQGWKKRVKTKENWNNDRKAKFKRKNGKNKDLLETTTALFIPPTGGGKLSTMIADAELNLSKETGWKVKVLENSGTPLVQFLKPSFEMYEGCVLGVECILCRNSGVGCTSKNVIYEARCVKCKNSDGMVEHVYIGETSRPVLARVVEHIRKAEKLSSESFMVQHWCTHHGTDTEAPKFEFKVIKTCREALSRQVGEAVLIEESGNLNSKAEFGMNHLCRLVSQINPQDEEAAQKVAEKEKRRRKNDLLQFINVIQSLRKRYEKLTPAVDKSNLFNSRSQKRGPVTLSLEQKRSQGWRPRPQSVKLGQEGQGWNYRQQSLLRLQTVGLQVPQTQA